MVVDPEKGTVLGEIPNTTGVHGIAVANYVGKGFTSNGRDNTVTVFDLKDFSSLSKPLMQEKALRPLTLGASCSSCWEEDEATNKACHHQS